ncbi:hypothetical protein C8R44DRAFT_648747 [Mycena epipterygia]|nr:hypothetical protein C8R44DRAFT_648747 [Mycena epipterygia]
MICVSTILLAVVANILSAPATAGLLLISNSSLAAPIPIDLGMAGGNDLAWVSGQTACNNVGVGPTGANPCGRAFGLAGQSGFTVENCGAGDLFINQNGAFYAQCTMAPFAAQCGIERTWHCV